MNKSADRGRRFHCIGQLGVEWELCRFRCRRDLSSFLELIGLQVVAEELVVVLAHLRHRARLRDRVRRDPRPAGARVCEPRPLGRAGDARPRVRHAHPAGPAPLIGSPAPAGGRLILIQSPSLKTWRYRLGVRTGGSQPSNRGSNPRSATIHLRPSIKGGISPSPYLPPALRAVSMSLTSWGWTLKPTFCAALTWV